MRAGLCAHPETFFAGWLRLRLPPEGSRNARTVETSLRHLHEAPEELRSMTAFPRLFEKAA
jgi:hypothetical protein